MPEKREASLERTSPVEAMSKAEAAAQTTRREFLKIAGGAAGAVIASASGVSAVAEPYNFGHADTKHQKGSAVKPTLPMATGRVIGANDRILVAHVGVGGRGADHLVSTNDRLQEYNVRSIAVSDCYTRRLDGAKAAILQRDSGGTVQTDQDYRKILENKDVDAVIVATPEHWHSQVSIDAMNAGKHVYCEKPMSRYLNEALAMWETQKRTGKVVQVGAQGCSDTKWWTAGQAVRDGKIGQIVSAQDSYCRNSKEGEWNYYIEPEANAANLDWARWLGSAPSRPWGDGTDAKARFFRYRKYRDYSAGLLGDLLPHRALPMMLAMFLNQPEFPVKVSAIGTRKIVVPGDYREVADTMHVTAEFPSGATLYVLLSTVNEQGVETLIRGHKATLRFGGDHVHLNPEQAFADEVDEADLPITGPSEDTNVHRGNWFDCIRNGKTPTCNIDLAVRAQAVISLAEMSELHSKTMRFDPLKREIMA